MRTPPSRRAALPQLGHFVARCISGGASTLSEILEAAGASRPAATTDGSVNAGAETPSGQRLFLALLWVASQHNAWVVRPGGLAAPLPLPAARQLELVATGQGGGSRGDVEIRFNPYE